MKPHKNHPSMIPSKAILISIVVLLSITFVKAQNEANNWIFGNQARLNFSSGNPVGVTFTSTPPFNTQEGSSSISDQNGNLLFYTDGRTVWNRNNTQMPAGSGLLGDSSATQSALIVPWPGSECLRYYIFTVDAQENVAVQTLRYSVVDLALAGGFGDIALPVTSNKNISLRAQVSEKLTAVADAAGTGFWVVAHGYNKPTSTVNSEYYAYHILPGSGLNTTPVVSGPTGVGSPHDSTAVSTKVPSAGQMKISPDGTRIACAVAAGFVEVLNFSTTSGLVTGPARTTPGYPQSSSPFNHYSLYGLEFSHNSQVLYVTTLASPGNLYQLNLASSTSTWTLIATGTAAASGAYDLAQLQLGRDNKIYVARDTRANIGVINSPVTLGTGANYVAAGPLLPFGNSRLGLPTMIGGSFSCSATPRPSPTPTATPRPSPTLSATPSSSPTATPDPCCPPWNAAVMSDMLVQDHSGGINAPYTLHFQPTTAFNSQMQTYINYLYASNPSITKITIAWQLHDQGTGTPCTNCVPPYGTAVGPTEYTTWTQGGNGNPVFTNPNFFDVPPYPMVKNRCYMIHTGIYLEGGQRFFPESCGDAHVCVQWVVSAKQPPVIELRAGKNVIRRIPVTETKK